jgi:hypothetical protein
MEVSLPKTKAGWIATGIVVALVAAFLLLFTSVPYGHAVEISLENSGSLPVFASIDNTGRHGEGTPTTTLPTTSGSTTPPGLRINAGQTRSFGFAVGLFDSPTIHLWQIKEDGSAVSDSVQDCPFDTFTFKKLEIPSIHKQIKWNGSHCELSN